MIQDLKRRSATAVEQYHAILDEEEARQAEARQAVPSVRPYSITILGQLLLDAALTPIERKRLARAPGLSVLIESPTAEWVKPLHRAVGAVGPWVHNEMRDGTSRHRRKPDDGADEIAETMARGGRVCIVCHAPSAHLHRSFLGAVDLHMHRGVIHLYGHSHGILPGTAMSTDVGVDCFDFRPVNLDEIRLRLAENALAEGGAR